MDPKTLLKNLSIGFLPLLVFILADELFGLTVGLITAIVFGLGECGWVCYREKRLDRFILFDTGLIVLLGVVSLISHNDLFIKLKPGLVELILSVLLAVGGFTRSDLLLKMTGRYVKDFEFSPAQVRQMRSMMRRMFYIILFHTALIFYSAFYLSTEAWGFISGGLFYILLGVLFVSEFARVKWKSRQLKKQWAGEEWFDIVTPEGKVVGKAPRSVVHGNPDLLHPVVHVHIVNAAGQLFLQKRSPEKDLYPDRWDTAVGGHVSSGESIEQALGREAQEELGIANGQYRPLFRYVMRNQYESELIHAFLLQAEGPFELHPQEISGGRFWSLPEIEANLGKNIFTPNFEQEFLLLKQHVFQPAPPVKTVAKRKPKKKKKRKR